MTEACTLMCKMHQVCIFSCQIDLIELKGAATFFQHLVTCGQIWEGIPKFEIHYQIDFIDTKLQHFSNI